MCIDRTVYVGLVVYGYNEITGNISGQCYELWSEREKWCLDKLTLNGNLPLDVIDVVVLTKTTGVKQKKDAVVQISGSGYYKINADCSTAFTTRAVSHNGIYSCNNQSVEVNTKLLEKAGFLDHENCIPYLATTKASKTHRVNVELRKML